MKDITCDICNKPIKHKEDLVTTVVYFLVRPFHNSCFSNQTWTSRVFFLQKWPLNTELATIVAVVAGISSALTIVAWVYNLILFKEPSVLVPLVVALALLVPAAMRWYSWKVYEQVLK